MRQPLVSIVMSVYNAGAYLEESIMSICSQTFQDWELIVIDDASTDATPAILDSFHDTRIVRIENPHNLGLTRSLNRGLQKVRGRYIARHDADDCSHPRRIERQVQFLTDNDEIVLLGTDYEMINPDGDVIESVRLPHMHRDLMERLEKGNIFCHGSVLFRAEPVRKLGFYRESFPVTQDYDLWLRIGELYKIANIPELLYQFRFDAETISRKNRALQLSYRSYAQALHLQRVTDGCETECAGDIGEKYPPERESLFRDARGTAYLYFASGNFKQAKLALKEARTLVQHGDMEDAPWGKWILDKANQLTESRGALNEGVNFIRWACEVIEPLNGRHLQNHVLGNFFADRAFTAFYRKKSFEVLILAFKAMLSDTRWLKNRGLWSIGLKSLFPEVFGNDEET